MSCDKAIRHSKYSYKVKIKKVPEKPADFPEWLKLPALKGVANDYSFIEEARNAWLNENGTTYRMAASIVIPVYNRSTELDFVLAGLVHQTYPKSLMEVVIADDGSREDLAAVYEKYRHFFPIKYCRQDDLGYRLSKARNMGIQSASHESIIILDSDAIPNEELVEKYMQYFHVSGNIAMFGLRHYVSVAHIEPADYLRNKNLIHEADRIKSENNIATAKSEHGWSTDWREQHLPKTNDGKDHKHPFTFLIGANCAFTKELFHRAGGYSEDFRDWGFEDQEFGYRLLREGAYFIPVKDNYVYHQEPVQGKNDTNREQGAEKTKVLFIQKCPFIHRKRAKSKQPYEVPLVSIYIPLYNRENYIVECVQSALNQTVKDLEVVICDDGSTDNSVELIKNNFGNNKRIRLIQQENSGIGAASNTAVRNARGYYIGQLDADDVLMADAVEHCLHAMEKDYSLSLVYGTTEYIDEHSNFISKGWNWPAFSREHLLAKMIVHHFRFFRKRDYMRTSGFDETILNAVDYDMMLKLSEIGRVKHINRVLYKYRRHSGMTSVSNKEKQNNNNLLVVNKALERMGLHDVVATQHLSQNNSRNITFERGSGWPDDTR